MGNGCATPDSRRKAITDHGVQRNKRLIWSHERKWGEDHRRDRVFVLSVRMLRAGGSEDAADALGDEGVKQRRALPKSTVKSHAIDPATFQ